MGKIIALTSFLLITAGAFFFAQDNYLEKKESRHCNNLYKEIREEIEEKNYCEVDSDCDVLVLGGSYIDFGCYHFVNKETDKNYFYGRMREYYDDCVTIINECAPAPNPQCIEGKCAYIKDKHQRSDSNEEKSTSVVCENYTYTTCPEDCLALCMPSVCSFDEEMGIEICTDDCDGPGSCVAKM